MSLWSFTCSIDNTFTLGHKNGTSTFKFYISEFRVIRKNTAFTTETEGLLPLWLDGLRGFSAEEPQAKYCDHFLHLNQTTA